jgi:uncharacterized repeat protein (TIGR01451 family)
VNVGEEFTIYLHVTNVTDLPLRDVVVTEKLPAAMELSHTDPQASISGDVATWKMDRLGPGQTAKLAICGKATGPGQLVGCTDVAYKPAWVCVALTAVQPDLAVTKTGPEQVILCDPIVYTLRVSNSGSGVAKDVVVTENLPEGLETFDGKSEVEIAVGDLPAGKYKEYTVRVRPLKTGDYTNVAHARAADGLKSKSAPVTVRVRNPQLVIRKSAPDVRYIGRNVTMTIEVSNVGTAPAEGVVVRDEIPQNAEFVDASAGAQVSGKNVTWNLGDIGVDQKAVVRLTVKPTAKGELRSVASATAECTRGSGESVTRVEGIAALLLETIDVDDPVEVGGQTTYRITVTNQGSATATNVAITAMLPGQEEFVSADGPTAHELTGTSTVKFQPVSALEPKDSVTFNVTIKATAPGDVRFRTELRSDQIGEPVFETESTTLYE